MDHGNSPAVELDVKDILLFVLRKAHIVLLIGIAVALFAFGFAYYKSEKASSTASIESVVLNTEAPMANESNLEYSNRIQLVNRAHTIMDNIESMNSQCDYLRNYIDNSLLMQLDPMNVSVSEVNFIIETDGEVSDGISDALIDSYANSVRSGN